jgi:hypothetical protein
LVERQFCKLDVAGSIPATGTTCRIGTSGDPDRAAANKYAPLGSVLARIAADGAR